MNEASIDNLGPGGLSLFEHYLEQSQEHLKLFKKSNVTIITWQQVSDLSRNQNCHIMCLGF